MKEIYKQNNIEKVVNESSSMTEALRLMGLRPAGGNYKVLKKYITLYKLDITHYELHRKERLKKLNVKNTKPLETILVENSNYTNNRALKKRLYTTLLKEQKCEMCNQGEIWNGKKISLILDHINGVHTDNRLENLRIVCPNCNATLDTHCGKNNSKRNIKIKNLGLDINEKHDLRKHTMVDIENSIKRRKVIRPSLETILQDIKELGYCGTGRKYGVSDNAIRKWIK